MTNMKVLGQGRLDKALNRLEEAMVLKAYQMCGNSKAKAGRMLGVTRTRIIWILKRHGHQDKIHDPIVAGVSRRKPASPYCDMATKQPAIIAT